MNKLNVFVLPFFSILASCSSSPIPAQNPKSRSNADSVFVDHVFIQVDSRTYTALSKDNWLCGTILFCEHNKKVATWEGHYFQGTTSYIEFFDAQKMKSHPYIHQQSALGLFNEKLGALDAIHKLLKESEPLQGKFKIYDQHFARSSYAFVKNFATWVLEPFESFLGSKDITRQNWSAFMRHKANSTFVPKVLSFSKLVFELSKDEYSLASEMLRTLNFSETPIPNGLSFSNGETSIEVYSTQNPRGLIEAEQRLEAPYKGGLKTKKYGSVKITLDGQNQKLLWAFY